MKHLMKFEDIKVPIEVGDIVLGGRFKNKKLIIKKIGKNKKGDITINDKPLLKYRIVKESLEEDVNYYFKHLEDDGFSVDVSDDYIRIYKPISIDSESITSYKYSNCRGFDLQEIISEISRYVTEVDDSEKSINNIYVMYKSGGNVHRNTLAKEQLLEENFNLDNVTSFTIMFK